MLVVIDQPIIVPNASGTRPVDSVAKSFMGQLGSAAQHANRSESRIKASMFGDEAPIWKFIGKIVPSEFLGRTTGPVENRAFVNFSAAKAATGQTRMIEVYPAMALPALESGFMELRRKKRRYAARYDPSRDNFSPQTRVIGGTLELSFTLPRAANRGNPNGRKNKAGKGGRQ